MHITAIQYPPSAPTIVSVGVEESVSILESPELLADDTGEHWPHSSLTGEIIMEQL